MDVERVIRLDARILMWVGLVFVGSAVFAYMLRVGFMAGYVNALADIEYVVRVAMAEAKKNGPTIEGGAAVGEATREDG